MVVGKAIYDGEAVSAEALRREETYPYAARGRMAGAEIDADGSIPGASRRCGSHERPTGSVP